MKEIVENWWRRSGIWDRQQASGILVDDFDWETEIYLAATDDWWGSLTDEKKMEVYKDFFEEW